MNKVTVTEGQSLLDICLQTLGSTEALFDLATANGLAITDQLTPGQVLKVPAAVLRQSGVAAYFANRAQRINTGDLALGPQPSRPNDFHHPDFETLDFD